MTTRPAPAQPRLSVAAVIAASAAIYGVRHEELRAKGSKQPLSRYRQVAMTLAYQLTGCSYPEIGRIFHCVDHTSAIYAVRRTEARMATDAKLCAEMAEIAGLAEKIASYELPLCAAHAIGEGIRGLGTVSQAARGGIGGTWHKELHLAAASAIGDFLKALGPLPSPVHVRDERAIRAAWQRQVAASRADPNLSHLCIG